MTWMAIKMDLMSHSHFYSVLFLIYVHDSIWLLKWLRNWWNKMLMYKLYNYLNYFDWQWWWTWLWIDGNLLIVWLSYTRLYQLLILLISNCVRMFNEKETKIIWKLLLKKKNNNQVQNISTSRKFKLIFIARVVLQKWITKKGCLSVVSY